MKIQTPFKGKPDFEHFRKVIMRETKEGPVPIIELLADPEIMSETTGFDFPTDAMNKFMNPSSAKTEEERTELIHLGIKFMDLCLDFSCKVGYDYATMVPIVPIRRTPMQLGNSGQSRLRSWQNEHDGLIGSREDFENYPWPTKEHIITFPLDYAAGKMPEGMKALAFYIGVFEDLRSLLGFETLAVKSIEEPDLVEDILERLTLLAEAAMETIAAHPATGAVFYADDLGFKTATMLSPRWMREFLIPRQKRIADICHKHGKPFLFHSCGNVDDIMEDLIETVGIDARHSFEDNIEPVEEVYKKYGHRISIMGGVDVNLLSAGTPQQVRERTRQILEVCAPGGGYCIGSGNSVTNYCKVENYYAMLDETRRWNEDHY